MTSDHLFVVQVQLTSTTQVQMVNSKLFCFVQLSTGYSFWQCVDKDICSCSNIL